MVESTERAGIVEIGGSDRVAGFENVHALGPGDVEQDPPGHQRRDQMDPQFAGTFFGDGRGRIAVVELGAIGSGAVGHVGEPVPVGGTLHGQGDQVLGGGDPLWVRAEGLVHAYHRSIRIDSSGDEAHLDALVGRQGQGQGRMRLPSRTDATPRSRAAWSMRLRVPIWSSDPHRPQLETRDATSVNQAGIELGTGTGTDLLYSMEATVFDVCGR